MSAIPEVSSDRQRTAAAFVRAVPVALVIVVSWVLAWDTSGSIRAADWLPYAVLLALVPAAVLLAGAGVIPERPALAAVLLLASFAVWVAVSAAWSSLPSLARDDGLLALLYAIALLTPMVTLRTEADRFAASSVAVLGLSALCVATAFRLRSGRDPDLLYFQGRLDFPITYWNGQAAMALVGFWPAIALAARRQASLVLRAVSLGGATAMLTLWLGTQSKGGGVALIASAVVVFAVSSARLRLLVPVLLAGGIAAFGAVPLTDPFRTHGSAFDAAVRHAGTVTLVLAAAGLASGALYVLADRRVLVSARAHSLAGLAVLTVLIACILAGIGTLAAEVDHPVATTQQRWQDFKHIGSDSGSSHFTSLGSNRYDFWRVAWREFEHHPVAGIGGYGWASAYLRYGASSERPQRSHSVELDALSETGLIGFLLLVAAGVTTLVAIGRRARLSLTATGALGTAAYFALHTGADWVWTIPAVGLPVFAIAGIGATGDSDRTLPARAAVPAAAVLIAVAVVGFAPPWVSSRLVHRAYMTGNAAGAAGDLRWARRLDPLSVGPLIAQASLATPPANIPPLRRAVNRQPRDPEMHYLLGLAYLDLGRKAAARSELSKALRLSPRDTTIREALDRAR